VAEYVADLATLAMQPDQEIEETLRMPDKGLKYIYFIISPIPINGLARLDKGQ
jgi:hypothetical protein